MYGQSEIGDEFRPRNKEKERNGTAVATGISFIILHTSKENQAGTNPMKAFNIHSSPSIHPTVVSPRKLCQLKMRSSVNVRPATSTVKRISTPPET